MDVAELIKSIARAVAEEQARLRWLVMSIVSSAIKLSETELMDASRELMGLQHEARQSTEELRALMNQVGRDAVVVSQIFGYLSRFADEANMRLRQQVEVTERATNLTDQIGAFVGEIGKIANAVRVLTINGYIESTRLGGEGRAFAVIAEQLQDLGEQVRSANEGIRELAAGLGKLIPQLGDNARAMLRTTEQLESDHADAMHLFQGASSTARRELSSALQETQERTQRVSNRAGQALGHLHFQDRMAQQLRYIEHISSHTEKVMAAMFEQLGESQGRDPEAALRQARQAFPRRQPPGPGQAGEQALYE